MQNMAAAREIAILLGNGARPDELDKQGATPLHLAAIKGVVVQCQVLLSFGASLLTEFTEAGQPPRTPMHLAAHAGNGAVLEFLLLSFRTRHTDLSRQWPKSQQKYLDSKETTEKSLAGILGLLGAFLKHCEDGATHAQPDTQPEKKIVHFLDDLIHERVNQFILAVDTGMTPEEIKEENAVYEKILNLPMPIFPRLPIFKILHQQFQQIHALDVEAKEAPKAIFPVPPALHQMYRYGLRDCVQRLLKEEKVAPDALCPEGYTTLAYLAGANGGRAFSPEIDIPPLRDALIAPIVDLLLNHISPAEDPSPRKMAFLSKTFENNRGVWTEPVSYTHLTLPTKRIV